jgi:hypothetical protein
MDQDATRPQDDKSIEPIFSRDSSQHSHAIMSTAGHVTEDFSARAGPDFTPSSAHWVSAEGPACCRRNAVRRFVYAHPGHARVPTGRWEPNLGAESPPTPIETYHWPAHSRSRPVHCGLCAGLYTGLYTGLVPPVHCGRRRFGSKSVARTPPFSVANTVACTLWPVH